MLKMKWHHGHNNSIVNGIPRIGFMTGGESAKWIDEDMADTFLAEARKYVAKQKDEPFFLYYALQQPHVRRTPHPRFEGASGMGPRGDVIVEADWAVGEFENTLESEGLLENTLIVFSSDNGPAINEFVNIELGNESRYQLYNLKDDIGQQKNLAESYPLKLSEIIAGYTKTRGDGAADIEGLEPK